MPRKTSARFQSGIEVCRDLSWLAHGAAPTETETEDPTRQEMDEEASAEDPRDTGKDGQQEKEDAREDCAGRETDLF